MILKNSHKVVCYLTDDKVYGVSNRPYIRPIKTEYSVKVRKALGYKVIGPSDLTRWEE